LLPNAWDVATARAVVDAGYPVVATTSAGVAGALGHQDHEGAPAQEMLAAAARIARCVDIPVTVDAEAGYGMEPPALVAALRDAGAAGCNLEDTDYAAGDTLRDYRAHADCLGAVREAATEDDYPLVINARIDVFLWPFLAGAEPGSQADLVPEAVRRAQAYLDADVDCVYPIALWQEDALRAFLSEADGPVNVVRLPTGMPPLAKLAALGVARVSWGPFLFRDAMARFDEELAALQGETGFRGHRC
jgi:2-methylisocitrate lyase-like PEP mutase family enzyme